MIVHLAFYTKYLLLSWLHAFHKLNIFYRSYHSTHHHFSGSFRLTNFVRTIYSTQRSRTFVPCFTKIVAKHCKMTASDSLFSWTISITVLNPFPLYVLQNALSHPFKEKWSVASNIFRYFVLHINNTGTLK